MAHLCKITIENNLTLSHPVGCERVKLGYWGEGDKFFLYLGFDSIESANTTRDWLIRNNWVTPYHRDTDSGCNKPRKAERMPQAYELKIHRPKPELVDLMISTEKAKKSA